MKHEKFKALQLQLCDDILDMIENLMQHTVNVRAVMSSG